MENLNVKKKKNKKIQKDIQYKILLKIKYIFY